ncbi:MAG: helix-turn-helix transcriptional regulator [Pseudomonadota bacterium]
MITDLADRHLVSCHWTPTARSRRLACDILEASRTKNSLQKLQMESCSIALVAETFYQISSRNVSQNQKHTRSLSRWQQQRVATIRDRLSDDPMNVESLTALARNAGMSVSTLQRYFKELTGTTIISYIRRCRLEQARLVIREQGITIGEAAYLSGYSNPSNFVAAFKRTFGMSPSALIS